MHQLEMSITRSPDRGRVAEERELSAWGASDVIHEYAIYGLSEEGALLSTEWYLGVNEKHVRALAKERLRLYPIVEVLEGASLVLRLRRSDSS